MNVFLGLAFLFFIGSVLGWFLELIFRRFFSSANPERKWINPSFLVGPYLPMYGTGLCVLYLLASLQNHGVNRWVLLVLMAVGMTVLEYLVGLWLLKVMKVRLWDYSKQPGNLQGLICPKFSLAWGLLSAAYLFLVHPHVLAALQWLKDNLAFSFVVGMFFGFILVDYAYSSHLMLKIKRFAQDNDVVVRYESIKSYLSNLRAQRGKRHFFLSLHTEQPLPERLRQYYEHLRELEVSFERLHKNRKK